MRWGQARQVCVLGSGADKGHIHKWGRDRDGMAYGNLSRGRGVHTGGRRWLRHTAGRVCVQGGAWHRARSPSRGGGHPLGGQGQEGCWGTMQAPCSLMTQEKASLYCFSSLQVCDAVNISEKLYLPRHRPTPSLRPHLLCACLHPWSFSSSSELSSRPGPSCVVRPFLPLAG